VTLDIDRGSFTAIVGESGSGKSTLLSLLGGLDRPTSGAVEVDGVALGELSLDGLARMRASHVGFVFQDYNLVQNLTALENVTLPLELAGKSFRRARGPAEEQLTRFGLAHRLNNFPDALSGGERQRVALARATVRNQPVLIADEPTGALDSENGQSVVAVLRELALQGTCCLVATHNPAVAALADRVVEMRDGLVVADSAGLSG
jgi:putative ABC transport system ATP-binding protein